jgi:hypothetical protein
LEGDYTRQGNVGAAVGWYHEPKRGGGFSKGEYGLVILTFDGDEIVDILFIPFDKLEEELENSDGGELIEYINAWLKMNDASMNDLRDVLGGVAEYCGEWQKDYELGGLLMATYGAIIGYYCFPASVPPLVASVYCGRRASMYDEWEDLNLMVGYNLPASKNRRDLLH